MAFVTIGKNQLGQLSISDNTPKKIDRQNKIASDHVQEEEKKSGFFSSFFKDNSFERSDPKKTLASITKPINPSRTHTAQSDQALLSVMDASLNPKNESRRT